MPNGSRAVSVPIAVSSSPNRSANILLTEPSERKTTPNSSIPKQAAAKTWFLRYMLVTSAPTAVPDSRRHKVPRRRRVATLQTLLGLSPLAAPTGGLPPQHRREIVRLGRTPRRQTRLSRD